jgi:hypothetical protein
VSQVFDAGEAVSTGRVRLSRLGPADVEAMSGWLASSLAPEWRVEDLAAAAVETGGGVLISDADGARIGSAVVTTSPLPAGIPSPSTARGSRPEGLSRGRRRPTDSKPIVACVPFIAIDPVRRFRGLGGEAGLALERHLRKKLAVERVLAPVPDGRGLAVYFWLRLGYRPLTGSEAPWPLVGLGLREPQSEPIRGMWMARETGL